MISNEFRIIDNRTSSEFKKMSFSGYLVKDVSSAFNKALIGCKIEDACNWGVELLISGYIDNIWDKIFNIAIKNININNPKIGYLLYLRYSKYINLCSNWDKKDKLSLRNNQEIRNMVCELCFLICNSLKTKSIAFKKINEKDFDMVFIESRLIANKPDIVYDKIKFGDPEETRIILNELNYCLINKKFELCLYWLSWILEWEKKIIKKKKVYLCGYRKIENVETKYCNDIVWFIWEIILKESSKIDNNNITQNIHALYRLYKFDYKPSKKGKRNYYFIYAIKYFTDTYHFPENINNYYLLVQACANINFLFFDKNKYSINNNKAVEKQNYKKNIKIIKNELNKEQTREQSKTYKKKLAELKKITEEKMKLKINTVEQIDSLILKNSNN